MRSKHDPAESLADIIENITRIDDAAVLVPGQRWNDIRGMGNRLRHAYDRIRLDVLWNAITKNLPELKTEVDGR